MSHAVEFALLVFVIVVAACDMRTRRIPNVLTVTAAIGALALHLAEAGVQGLLAGSAGCLVGLVMFMPFFLAGGFGAGDVKAMAAIGAFVGMKGVLLAGAMTLIVGAVGGLALLVIHGGFPALLALARRWMLRALLAQASQSTTGAEPPQNDPASRRFPYGLAIAGGTVISLIWS